ncbi:unnamed protein product [Orchesella dallaii]|uniref:Uncharacterized protein n=1 Tax=Orchesella dallaii TaxID=48710 RepID=A0ABP1RLW8_9HEXA
MQLFRCGEVYSTVNSTATKPNKIIDEVSKLPEEDPDIAIISCISSQLDNNINMESVPATRVSENFICCRFAL